MGAARPMECPKGGISNGTIAEMKAALRRRDERRGYVPDRSPWARKA
jgi:hypothetical protein